MPNTILFAWELGGGLGHLAPVAPFFGRLREMGYRVVLAGRDLSRARPLLGGLGVELVQAPIKTARTGDRIDVLRSFAHIAHNCGLADFDEFAGLAEAWRQLFEYVRPNIVLCDHAPIALVTARGMAVRHATIGTGFCCPPDIYPLPDFRPWLPNAEEAIRQDEDRVTENVNRLLEERGCDPIDRLGQLYGEVDDCFLTTFAEIDHYPCRRGGQYWGPLDMPMGDAPIWPKDGGKKAFAYLKLTRELPIILRALEEQELCSLVYVDRLPFRLKVRYESNRLRIVTSPVNLREVGQQCELAILTGGHGSTASMLLSGRPVLQIPGNLEQTLTGLAVERIQAGLCVNPKRPTEAPQKLQAVAASNDFAAGAARFAEGHRDFDPARQIDLLVERVGELAGTPSLTATPHAGGDMEKKRPKQIRPTAEAAAQHVTFKTLPADLAIVSVFFNPVGYRSTVENFRKFYRSLCEQGIELHAVEVAFGDAPFYVADLPGVRQVRTRDVMWQLERMINHTIAGLPDCFTKVAWLDTDVFFENRNWFRETSEALDQNLVVQPFRDALWMDADGGTLRRATGMAAAMNDHPHLPSDPGKVHPGFAWGAQRELIAKHGLPDFSILGGGDRIFANAIYNVEWAREMSYFPPPLQQRVREWKTAFAPDVKSQATYIDGTVYHLWHGKLADRKYHVRNVPLLNHNFDPTVDIRIGDDGAWHWATDKLGLHEEVRTYFIARRSDG
jgi:hypothetical protein